MSTTFNSSNGKFNVSIIKNHSFSVSLITQADFNVEIGTIYNPALDWLIRNGLWLDTGIWVDSELWVD